MVETRFTDVGDYDVFLDEIPGSNVTSMFHNIECRVYVCTFQANKLKWTYIRDLFLSTCTNVALSTVITCYILTDIKLIFYSIQYLINPH